MKEIDKVKKYIEQYNMIQKEDSVIVGVSGGADSVCLYKILCELKKCMQLNIVVVHIHHGIRGEEADRDMNFVKEMCAADQNECVIYKYDVPAYAKENSLSEEEAGRILRYETFNKVADDLKMSAKIAVAHNLNDSGETFIHNLCRGSGLKGLTGISAKQGMIIRPLLCFKRAEIENYLLENNIPFINDSTNFLEEYTRNKIRLRVLPYLQQNINNGSIEHICEAAEEINEAEEYLQAVTSKMYEKIVYEHNNCIYIKKKGLRDADVFIRKRIVRMAVYEYAKKLKDITRQHIMDILELLDKQTGKYVMLPYDILVYSEYDNIVLKKKVNSDKIENSKTEINKSGIYCLEEYSFEVEILEVENANINIKFLENSLKSEQKMYTKCFDYDKIDFVVQLRFRESGDYIVVNSLGDRKKLKSYFVDEKIPGDERGKIPLFADGLHIMWIVGHRISEKYKITSDTKRILKITRKDKSENAGQN